MCIFWIQTADRIYHQSIMLEIQGKSNNEMFIFLLDFYNLQGSYFGEYYQKFLTIFP